MAFSFGNTASAPAGAGGGLGGINQGPDLEVIQTESLGFLSLAGESKLRLISKWSPPPVSNASLLSIAPRRGLVAAAGPDAIIVATTEAVRKAFEAQKDNDSEIRSFQPQLKIPLPVRICQLAFTTDENYLIMSAEHGGGLGVYEVQALLQGSTKTAFQIPTNSEALRALIPNPSQEKSDLVAVVTDKGNLLTASMKDRDFVLGRNGQILKTQVSCAAWSTRGKQLVAGLGDGTIQQMTPEGDVKAEIPRPSGLDANYFVSFLSWLENDVFLAVHVSALQQPPQSKYHLITRQGQAFACQKLTDPVDPFGSDKVPHHTAARLKDFPPNIQDVLIFSSTATPDIGLLSRSKAPLSSEFPAEKITNVFTTTEMADDSKRATLPMGEGMDTPVPIGTALDLSSKDTVYKPIPTDEIEQSPGPLPGYWVLNDEGVLSIWWVVYTDSIREGTSYSGLAALQGSASQSSAPIAAPAQTVQPSAFGASSASPFGAAAPTPAPAFGGASALGTKPSPWGSARAASTPSTGGAAFGSSVFGSAATSTAPKFGTPSFGSNTFGQPTPAFGQSTDIGAKASPWASSSTTATTPAFGQSGFASAGAGSGGGVFGSSSGNNNASSGFAGFANQGGFASLGSDAANSGASIFASNKSGAADVSMGTSANTSFPPPSSKPAASTGNPFGSQPFKMTSSFQREPSAKDDEDLDYSSSNGNSMFGNAFSSALGGAAKAANTASAFSMGDLGSQPPPRAESTTPTTTPAPPKFLSQLSTASQSSGLFGLPSKGTSSIFENPALADPPAGMPQIKVEAETPTALQDIPETPLPPDTTSKASYPLGESSSSSAYSADSPDNRKAPSDAPLPPDSPLPPGSPPAAFDDAPLPPDPKKNKKAYDVKFDPLPGQTTSKPKSSDDSPLPPDPVRNKKVYDVKFQPVPGVRDSQPSLFAPLKPQAKPQAKPPSIFDSATPKQTGLFVFPSNPPPVSDSDEEDDEEGEEEGEEDEQDEDEEDDDGEASEGSGVDVAQDLSPPSGDKDKTPGITPQSSFDGLGGSFSTISRPEPERKSLFGEIGRNVPVFLKPNPLSPRSPSPVRSAVPSRIMGNDQSRSFSAPGMASQILGASKRPPSHMGTALTAGMIVSAEDQRLEQQRKARAQKEAEESQPLVDEDEEERKKLLREDIEPTLYLDEFVAHAGPVPSAGDSIPAQVEAVYRDINAMIDMLGLNARSLANFIKGHAQAFKHEHRDKYDLASPDDWTIGDLEGLSNIISEELTNELENARVTDVEGKVAQCQDLQRDLARDRNKRNDLQKLINTRFDPDQALANRSLPLSAEQAAQQNDLRRDFARIMKILADTEDGLGMLKAKIVSTSAASGKGGSTPTIEAVMRTITKMTSMVEKRSGDIDVLENQMRKLRFSSPAAFNSSTRSREGSPFMTPQMRLTMFSPERSMMRKSPMRQSMSAAVGLGSIGGGMFALRTPPRKKLSGYGDAEKKAVKERKDRRGVVLGKLRASLAKKGPGVWSVEDFE